MPRRKNYTKSNATGFTKMLKPSCKKRNGGSRKDCKVWVATKNVTAKTALGYRKSPDQTPRASKKGSAAAAPAEEAAEEAEEQG